MSQRRDRYFQIRTVQGPSAAYEYLASEFRSDTGMAAPGKDVAAEEGGPDIAIREVAWMDWRQVNGL